MGRGRAGGGGAKLAALRVFEDGSGSSEALSCLRARPQRPSLAEASGRRLGICHESATTLGPLITCSPTHVSWRKEHEPYIPGILLGKTCSNFLQAEFFPIACITCLYAIELAELISWQPETSTQAPSFPYLFFGQSDHYCSFT